LDVSEIDGSIGSEVVYRVIIATVVQISILQVSPFFKETKMLKEQESKQAVSKLLSAIKQDRDEMRVQIHLAGQEVKDEWNRLSDRLNQLNDQWLPLEKAVGETAKGVVEGLRLTGEEVLEGFRKIRKSLPGS
jgi:uncharacterized protein YrzB (UPF0473 family)